MAGSFRKIDYSLRPAKHAERRMFAEIFRHLRPFQPIENYTYVGFGSLWFSDCVLFHRLLGVRKMISLEREESAKTRFEANRPFECVTVRYEKSSTALPKLDWTERHFIWLDYDDPLQVDILDDARAVALRARSGSVCAISVQCQKAPEIAESERSQDGVAPFDRFLARFGRERIPVEANLDDLYGWPFGTLSRQIILNEIEAALTTRNATAAAGKRLIFEPICAFEYDDNAKMTTIIGIFVADEERDTYNDCGFADLDFIRNPGGVVRITMPNLTVREIREIERTLPWAEGAQPQIGTLPSSDVKKFADYYRYLPNFAVLEG